MSYRQPFKGDYGISQGYGDKDTSAFHTGIDYLCPLGTPILASEAGTVIYAGWRNGGYGNCVFIQHADGMITIYEHLEKVTVSAGQDVRKGQVIGYSGSTGNSTGPHLHFEMRDANGKTINPLTMLHTVDDSIGQTVTDSHASEDKTDPAPALKGAKALGPDVEVICTLGAKGWYANFNGYTVFPQGTDLTYTGKTCERNGYTYCEVYPEPKKYWVAVNDGVTQILDNRE